jgi:hypothetical protein
MRRTKKPASPEQLAANRANAAHSSGPKTPEGKARSAQNSVKHGFTASTFVVVRLEDLQEIARLKSDLVSVYQPVNAQELFALERMALSQQAILRAARLESGLFTTSLNETLDTNDRPFTPMSKELAGDGDIEITRAQNRNYCLAEGFLRLVRQSNGWSIFLRYQAQAERQYRRALEDFDRLKALRHDLPNEELPNEDLPNEPISNLQAQHESTTYPSPETNPPPQENEPSAHDADPSADIPQPRRFPRKIPSSPRHPAPYSPAARLLRGRLSTQCRSFSRNRRADPRFMQTFGGDKVSGIWGHALRRLFQNRPRISKTLHLGGRAKRAVVGHGFIAIIFRQSPPPLTATYCDPDGIPANLVLYSEIG